MEKMVFMDGLLSVGSADIPSAGGGTGCSLLEIALGLPQDIGGRAVDILEKVHDMVSFRGFGRTGPLPGHIFIQLLAAVSGVSCKPDDRPRVSDQTSL